MLDLKWAKSQLIEYRVKKINPNTILFFFFVQKSIFNIQRT